jgi:hypothetical protein
MRMDEEQPASNLPAYEVVVIPGPLAGYGEANSGHPPLACLRCGALVVNVARHDDWHAVVP